MAVAGGGEALTFDVFGTVVNWRESIAAEAKTLLGGKGLDHDWNDFALKWRAKYQPAMEKVRSGERPWVKRDDLHRENLEELPGELGIAGLSEAEKDRLKRAWHRLEPWPDTVEDGRGAGRGGGRSDGEVPGADDA